MRVLCVNKFWYRRGGLERVMFDEIELLEGKGHEIAHFSTAHSLNLDSPWSGYFVPAADLGPGAVLSPPKKAVAALRMFSNRDAADRFEALVREFRPDIIHAHGVHRQLSPSILLVARRLGVPVVQTLHDFHHVCPADVLLLGGDVVCDPRRCGRYDYSHAALHRCVRGSLAASALSAAETGFQRVRRVYERAVTRFICPSHFLARVMSGGGWTVPLDVIPNAVPVAPLGGGGEYALFVGRLSAEKGVEVFLSAARTSGVPAVVAGEGPLSQELRCAYPEARFLGRVDGPTVESLISAAAMCVVPSRCYENAPLSVLEPMAAGVPVIASAIGGIPELLEHGVSGLLVQPGDVDELACAIRRLRDEPGLGSALGAAARQRVATCFSPEQHLQSLLHTYQTAMSA